MLPTGRPAWIMLAHMRGMPISSEITWAISSLRAPSASARRWMYLPRSSGSVWLQVSKAALAAATAASTSAAVPSGMDPMTCSVEALTTSMRPVPVEGTQAPSM